jgi:hypothetical protein
MPLKWKGQLFAASEKNDAGARMPVEPSPIKDFLVKFITMDLVTHPSHVYICNLSYKAGAAIPQIHKLFSRVPASTWCFHLASGLPMLSNFIDRPVKTGHLFCSAGGFPTSAGPPARALLKCIQAWILVICHF